MTVDVLLTRTGPLSGFSDSVRAAMRGRRRLWTARTPWRLEVVPVFVEPEVAVPSWCLPCGRCWATAKSTQDGELGIVPNRPLPYWGWGSILTSTVESGTGTTVRA